MVKGIEIGLWDPKSRDIKNLHHNIVRNKIKLLNMLAKLLEKILEILQKDFIYLGL